MKKLLIPVIIILIAFTACSNDEKVGEESNPENDKDTVVGTWKTLKRVIFYTDGEVKDVMTSDCAQKGRLTFSKDGELISDNYYLDEGKCIKDEDEKTISQKWVKVFEERYRFDFVYIGPDGGEIEESLYYDITFPEEGIMEIRSKGEIPEIEYSYRVMKRIK